MIPMKPVLKASRDSDLGMQGDTVSALKVGRDGKATTTDSRNQENAMATKSIPDSGENAGESPLPLELVLAYEDKSTCERAKRAVESVLRKPEVNSRSQFHLWPLDALSDPGTKERAAEEAAAADILVVSLHGRNRLADQAESVLKRCVSRRHRKPRALVISLDSEAKPLTEANHTITQLRATAMRSGVAVLLHYGEPTRPGPDVIVAVLHGSESATRHIPDEVQHWPQSYRDRGINE